MQQEENEHNKHDILITFYSAFFFLTNVHSRIFI